MMRPMKKALVGVAVALAACGGKGADSPGECPDGTVLKGSDCVPADSAGDTSGGGGDSDAPKKKKHVKSGDEDTIGGNTEADLSPSSGGGGGGGKSYDKDEIDLKMKRSAQQIKANCGPPTHEEGKATGPWPPPHRAPVLPPNGPSK